MLKTVITTSSPDQARSDADHHSSMPGQVQPAIAVDPAPIVAQVQAAAAVDPAPIVAQVQAAAAVDPAPIAAQVQAAPAVDPAPIAAQVQAAAAVDPAPIAAQVQAAPLAPVAPQFMHARNYLSLLFCKPKMISNLPRDIGDDLFISPVPYSTYNDNNTLSGKVSITVLDNYGANAVDRNLQADLTKILNAISSCFADGNLPRYTVTYNANARSYSLGGEPPMLPVSSYFIDFTDWGNSCCALVPFSYNESMRRQAIFDTDKLLKPTAFDEKFAQSGMKHSSFGNDKFSDMYRVPASRDNEKLFSDFRGQYLSPSFKNSTSLMNKPVLVDKLSQSEIIVDDMDDIGGGSLSDIDEGPSVKVFEPSTLNNFSYMFNSPVNGPMVGHPGLSVNDFLKPPVLFDKHGELLNPVFKNTTISLMRPVIDENTVHVEINGDECVGDPLPMMDNGPASDGIEISTPNDFRFNFKLADIDSKEGCEDLLVGVQHL